MSKYVFRTHLVVVHGGLSFEGPLFEWSVLLDSALLRTVGVEYHVDRVSGHRIFLCNRIILCNSQSRIETCARIDTSGCQENHSVSVSPLAVANHCQHDQNLHPAVRSNADFMITFGQEDPHQVDAICEQYLSKLPKPIAMQVLRKYAYREPASEGDQRYALMACVLSLYLTNSNRSM